ncbi:hypothetical protein CKA32_002614 [Geitlerinema sp. FC II]|nr:hypothetical protein CKA32_002614 [Geitlerinema sp. FC II]
MFKALDFSFLRNRCCCFLSCRDRAEPPFPLWFRPWRRGDSQRLSLVMGTPSRVARSQATQIFPNARGFWWVI